MYPHYNNKKIQIQTNIPQANQIINVDRMAQVVDSLPSKYEALSSILSTAQKTHKQAVLPDREKYVT
jgi:hypothetical protein